MKSYLKYGTSIASIASWIIAWEILALTIKSAYLPSPHAVFIALLYSFLEKDFLGFYLIQHIQASIARVLYGFLLASALAIPLGLLSGWFRIVDSFSSPIVEIIRPIPPLAWIPFAIYYFGEPFDAVFIVFLGVVFPILLSTISGVKSVDPILIDAAKTLGARGLTLFTKVVIPASVRSITTGIRIGLGVGWMSIVAAEMVGVRGGGLGYYIWAMSEVGRFDLVFSGMIVIGLIGYMMMKILASAEARLSTWSGILQEGRVG